MVLRALLMGFIAFAATTADLHASTISLPASSLEVRGDIYNLSGTLYNSDIIYSNPNQNSSRFVGSTGGQVVSAGSKNAIAASTAARSLTDPESPDSFTTTAASANLTYYFAVVHTGASVVVPITIMANLSAKVAGNDAAGAGAVLTINALTSQSYDVGATCCVSVSQQETVDDNASVVTNTAYSVEMDVVSNSQATLGQESSGAASIDPDFILSPELRAEGFSVVFSTGIGNGGPSAVPLPATAPMFGVALVILGSVGFRLRRKRAIAA